MAAAVNSRKEYLGSLRRVALLAENLGGMPTRNSIERFAAEQLKACPVCHTVQSRHSRACFVCDWRGKFITEPAVIEQALCEMLAYCPELHDVVILETRRPKLWQRFRATLRSLMGRLDLRA